MRADAPLLDAVHAMLRARFGTPVSSRPLTGLTQFQQQGVDRLREIIGRYRGALLADSVGLGKTHMARALILEETRAGGRVLVTGPAQLEAHWRRHLRGIRNWDWLSHTTLSRRGAALQPRWTFVVADEAHAFRNARTRRYDALSTICERARVLLVSATPVNNSVQDFYHLVRLFAEEDAFSAAGVPDLEMATSAAAHGAGVELRRVVECVVVRRTRNVILRTNTDIGGSLRFPHSNPVEMLRYRLEDSYPGMVDMLAEALASLRFAAHWHCVAAGTIELLRINLLKRLESSSIALRTSLVRHAAALRLFIDAAAAGRLFSAGSDADLLTAFCRHGQIALRDMSLPPWPLDRDRRTEMHTAAEDLARIDALLHALADLSHDAKADVLERTLLQDVAGERVLLFTEYRDTAVALWQRLNPLGGVALLHGSDARLGLARSSRRAVIERFAPLANGVRPPPVHQQVRLLIATDVLAEGMNLQDARVVISYDLPWNPVRLAQRIGRIDRLGSPHQVVRALAFRPDQGVDALLRLMERIREKLRIARLIGSDVPRLGGPARPRRRDLSRKRLLALTDLDHLELLRHRMASLPAPTRAYDTAPVAMAEWDGETPAVLWCLTRGPACWLVLVPLRGRPQLAARTTTRLLLQLVENAAHTEADGASDSRWLDRSLARARRAVERTHDRVLPRARRRSAAVHAGPRIDLRFQLGLVYPVAEEAVAVRRWLGSRPGGPSEEELALAEHRLEELRRPGHTGRPIPVRDQELRAVAGIVLRPRIRTPETSGRGLTESPGIIILRDSNDPA